MEIIEHNDAAQLVALVDNIVCEGQGKWIIVSIRREFLKQITNEAFMGAVRPALQRAEIAHVFFSNARSRIYLAWKGDLKNIYKQIRVLLVATLISPSSAVGPEKVFSYLDPHASGEALKTAILKNEPQLKGKSAAPHPTAADPLGWNTDDDNVGVAKDAPVLLTSTHEQRQHFYEMKDQRRYRKQPQFLIAEDHPFSQKLLCEILRSTKSTTADVPIVDAVDGQRAAWDIFLKKAPDMAFIDLGLADGSGHVLTQAIKELDPASIVIIVTANNYEEELAVARQNNVDGFIAKPYNKKQIADYVEKYIHHLKHGSNKQKSSGMR